MKAAHLGLGNGTRTTLRLADHATYAHIARAGLEGFVRTGFFLFFSRLGWIPASLRMRFTELAPA